MTFEEIFTQLRSLGSEHTQKTYKRHGSGENVFGVSFANYALLKKQFVGRGKDKQRAHALARQLWQTQNIDARSLATLIADPQQLTEAEVMGWVADIHYHALADLFAVLLFQAPCRQKKMNEWLSAPQEMLQRIAYTLLGRLALEDRSLPESFFEAHVQRLEPLLHAAPNRAKEAMNSALISIGSRSEALRHAVEQAADRLGPIRIDHGDTSCQTFVIREYLERIWARKQKLTNKE
ncbi:DNA alkylation repair protein [Hymenobacter algoricola]|uniref:DNA alkylation repair protein n=1 Tax=Hymenobacter algoricola TaxID=486267 RepID=A0ABP7MXN6_9BACT